MLKNSGPRFDLTSAGDIHGMSSSSVTIVLNGFTKHVQVGLADYLEPASKDEAKKLLALRERVHGLPGALGSIDCTHWMWDIRSHAHQGSYLGKAGTPSVVLEPASGNQSYL